MIKTNNDIIYNSLKNNAGFIRDKEFKKWFHEQYPGMIMHHLFGSYSQSLKTSDMFSIPVTAEEHEIAEKNKSDYAIDHLSVLLKVIQDYVCFLKNK